MASLIIVHRSGTRANDEVLLNRDHILFASRRTTEHGEFTDITLDYTAPGHSAALTVTEDLRALVAG